MLFNKLDLSEEGVGHGTGAFVDDVWHFISEYSCAAQDGHVDIFLVVITAGLQQDVAVVFCSAIVDRGLMALALALALLSLAGVMAVALEPPMVSTWPIIM